MYSTAKQINKTAALTTLPRITYTLRECGAAHLSPRARVYLAYFVALAKMGYCSLAVPIGALTRAQMASGGRYRSDRTTYLALAELEAHAYLRRSRYRIGQDHFRTVINLNLAALSYWTRQSVGKCTPISSKVGYVQGLQESPVTSKPTVTTSDSLVEHTYIDRTVGRMKSAIDSAVWKWAPVLYTLRCLLGSPRAAELRLAAAELHGLVESESGIEWAYWSSRWPELGIPAREGVARSELLPPLREAVARLGQGRLQRLPKPVHFRKASEGKKKNQANSTTYKQPSEGLRVPSTPQPEPPGRGVTPEMVRAALEEISRARRRAPGT